MPVATVHVDRITVAAWGRETTSGVVPARSSTCRFAHPRRAGSAGRPSRVVRWQRQSDRSAAQPGTPAESSWPVARAAAAPQQPSGATGTGAAQQEWTGATPAARGAATAGAPSRQQPAQASRAPGDRSMAATSAAARAVRPPDRAWRGFRRHDDGAGWIAAADPRDGRHRRAAVPLTQRLLRPGARPRSIMAARAPRRGPLPAAAGAGAGKTQPRQPSPFSPVSSGRRGGRGGPRDVRRNDTRLRPGRFAEGIEVSPPAVRPLPFAPQTARGRSGERRSRVDDTLHHPASRAPARRAGGGARRDSGIDSFP